MSYLFILDLAAGTTQHLKPLIVQKAKCIMHQKISLECPAGEQPSSGLRFTLPWWPGGGGVCLSISPGSSRKPSSPCGHARAFFLAICPGEWHDSTLSQCLPSYLGFSYLGHGVSLHGCSSKGQLLLLTLDEVYLLTATYPDL